MTPLPFCTHRRPFQLLTLCLLCAASAACAVPERSSPDFCAVSSGGAAPPLILSDEQRSRVRKLLAGYQAATLNAEQARAIQGELAAAGVRRGAALEAVLTEAGFTLRQLDALAPCPAPAPQAPATPASGRVVPRPQ